MVSPLNPQSLFSPINRPLQLRSRRGNPSRRGSPGEGHRRAMAWWEGSGTVLLASMHSVGLREVAGASKHCTQAFDTRTTVPIADTAVLVGHPVSIPTPTPDVGPTAR